ncbi:MAG TPA: dienelactone hydrolase family protein [Xanthomonadales bacterium]|nr:dienelactone hydrolase family protein [Xanthomonadales bacterium]
MIRFILTVLMALSTGMAMADIKTEEIVYSADGVNMKGHLAWDDSISGQRPGILVVHEWWGNNDYSRRRAEMLAALGYTALAVDMYGDGKTADHPQDAQKFMGEALANLPGSRERFNAALQQLKAHATVNPEKTAAIGYCFGGGVVLHMARYGADLDAVASFHGSLPLGVAPAGEGAQMKARVAVYNGEDDNFVSPEAIAAFKAEMEKAGANYQFINYPGAIHGFSNPDATRNGEKYQMALAYNALADQSSWEHMQLLFKSVFRE